MDANLTPVSKRISAYVEKFINDRIGETFTAGELRLYVSQNVGIFKVAPGSPDRIMRSLRQRKVINYELIDRAKSLYKGLPVVAAALPQADGAGDAA